MITSLGNDMEDPFGDDMLDLPLGQYCAAIDGQISAILERAALMTYNISEGPELDHPRRFEKLDSELFLMSSSNISPTEEEMSAMKDAVFTSSHSYRTFPHSA